MDALISVLPTLVGALVGGLTVYFGFRERKQKSHADLTGKVLEEWQKLLEAHKEQVASLTARVKLLEDENASLRTRVTHLEDELSDLKRKKRETDEENAGLRRQLMQIAESSGIISLEDGSATAQAASRYHEKKRLDRDRGDALGAAEKTVEAAEDAVEKVKEEKKGGGK